MLPKTIPVAAIDIDPTALSDAERKLLPHLIGSAVNGLVSGAGLVAWETSKHIDGLTRQDYLMTGCKLARRIGIDMIDIAHRLAQVRQNLKEEKARANPKPEQTDILDRVDHWPEPYRSAFKRMVWASRADDDALAEHYLRTGEVPLKRLERNRLLSIRYAVDRMFKWLESKRLPVRICDNMVGLWLLSLKTSKSGSGSTASYLGRIKALAAIALPGQDLTYLEKTQNKHAKLAKSEKNAPFGTGKPVALFDIADELNEEAEAALKDPSVTSQQAGLLYRDSVMHGLFAEIPLRGHNAVAMKFGHNYVENEDGTATVTFYPDETKEDNVIGPFPISKELARRVRRWLDVFRLMVSPFAGDWIFPGRCSEDGLSLCQLAKIVKRETGKSTHKIRHDDATEIYTELPQHRDYARVRLGQKRQSSTDGYAEHADARVAGRQHKEIRKGEISRTSQSQVRNAARGRTSARAQPAR
jgi:hypothetical protein